MLLGLILFGDMGRKIPEILAHIAVNGGLAFGAFSLGTWLRNKGLRSSGTPDDEPLWQTAMAEFESDSRRPGLWAQSFAEAQGNDGEAKAIYLRRRVRELQSLGQPAQSLGA